MNWETLTQTFIVGHDSGDFIEHSCEACAEEFAKQHELTWSSNHSFTEDHENGFYAYNALWDSGEADYPVACSCGQYLDVRLTSDGANYMREHGGFPDWLFEAHGIEKTEA